MDFKVKNTVYLAAAGSGKTTLLVNKACAVPSTEYVLMLTYTDSNEQEIRNKFYKENDGVIPKNVFIMSWFSFLLQHLIKPYQNYVTDDCFEIKGLAMPNNETKGDKKQKFRPIRKTNWKQYYFTNNQRVLSEKLSELASECNDKSSGLPIERLTNIFENIYIDEVQDLAGYDLELIKMFFLSKSNIVLAGDPRQTTYLTNHNGRMNEKYRDGKILDYLKDCKQLKDNFSIDTNTLNHSWRCCEEICKYASRISSDFPNMNSNANYQKGNCGVFLVRKDDILSFYEQYKNVMQLRWSKTYKNVISKKECKNFGDSKGQTFDSVLIYPTKDMVEWIENHKKQLKSETKNKFYVAVTRARYMVGIVWSKDTCSATDISFWTPSMN